MPNEELPSKFNILVFPPKFGQGNKLVATFIELGKTLTSMSSLPMHIEDELQFFLELLM
jgi:hypothetical protein